MRRFLEMSFMENTTKNFFVKVASALTAFSLSLSIALPIFASAKPLELQINVDKNGDGIVNYVALGSSDTAGVGLSGYNEESFGYKTAPDGSYPSLIKETIEKKGKRVSLSQLGIHGMRVEELRFLLDKGYSGDKYTEDLFLSADGAFSKLGVESLRAEYAEEIKNAELITLDVGFDNFATYAIGYIFDGKYDADTTRFGEDAQSGVNEIKARFQTVFESYLADSPKTKALVERAIDAIAYAIVGYWQNFDVVASYIYAINPKATVTVINTANSMQGLEAIIESIGFSVPLEMVWGIATDVANVYSAYLSKHSNRYYYAYVGDNGTGEKVVSLLEEYSANKENMPAQLSSFADAYIAENFSTTFSGEALLAARDAFIKLMRIGALDKSLDIDRMAKSYVSDLGSANAKIRTLISSAAANPAKSIESFEVFGEIVSNYSDVLAIMARFELRSRGLSLSALGHAEVCSAVISAINLATAGSEVISDKMNPIYSLLLEYIDPELLIDFESAFTPYYVCDSNSFYVALGDDTAKDESGRTSYATTLATELGLYSKKYKNHAKSGSTPDELLEILEKPTAALSKAEKQMVEDLLKADLITIGYSNVETTKYMLGSKGADWNGLLGEDGEAIKGIVADIKASLGESLGGLTDMVVGMAEKYAYAYIKRAIGYVQLVEKLHEMSPEALVVIVGTYNDMEGFELEFNGEKLPLGDYVQYLIDASNLEMLMYSAVTDKTAYIAAPDVETVLESGGTSTSWNIANFALSLGGILNKLAPSNRGHKYIANIVKSSIKVFGPHDHEYSDPCDRECNICHTKRVVGSHEYFGECDASCNLCGEYRIVPSHTYTAECDGVCNGCGEIREAVAHTFISGCDTRCDKCGASREADEEHSFGEWKNTRDGSERICASCGHAETSSEHVGMPVVLVVVISLGAVLALGGGGFSAFWFGVKKKSLADLINLITKKSK